MAFSETTKIDLKTRLGNSQRAREFISFWEHNCTIENDPLTKQGYEFELMQVQAWRSLDKATDEMLSFLAAPDLELPKKLETYKHEDVKAWVKEYLKRGSIKTEKEFIHQREEIEKYLLELMPEIQKFKALLGFYKNAFASRVSKTKRANIIIDRLCFDLVASFHASLGRIPSAGQTSDDIIALLLILSEFGYTAEENAVKRIKKAIRDRRKMFLDAGMKIKKGVIQN